MKLTARQASGFVTKKSWKDYSVLVFHGYADDSIRQYCTKILQNADVDQTDAFQYLRLDGKEVQSDPKILSYEASSSSLTGQDRWIFVQGKVSEIESALKPLCAAGMAERFGNNRLVIILEDATTKTALLKRCGDCDWMVTLPCYETSTDTLQHHITNFCKEQNWTCDFEAEDMLINLATGNLDILHHLLGKIALYQPDNNHLNQDIVMACAEQDQQQSLQDFTLATFSGKVEKADGLLRGLLEQKTSIIAIMRSLNMHCMKILRLKSLAEEHSLEQAMKMHQPPIFFKQAPEIRNQCQRWSNQQLAESLRLLLDQEVAMKSNEFHDNILLRQLILRLAKNR